MLSSPATTASTASTAPPRPAALTALLCTTAAAALSAVAAAVLVFTGGSALAAENVRSVFDELAPELGLAGMEAADVEALSGSLWQEVVDARASSLSARAGIAVCLALWLVVSAVFARAAATWARVLITIGGVLLVLLHLLVVADYPPGAVGPLGWVAVATGLATVVLCWSPAGNRYARAVKSARLP
ncbi:hypothetical protein [Amycolatopsis albispora]|uniref:Uncharacterized protein n=1 Tax=Amycolatopsis albispora TaxID=1804986 RepID=A0A344LD63_9PSEU|nr:hypothetical protein [Amycolatopsis albispora]AXB45987.1 hypothetical protein A4R43_28805 [Amycolatopsis albispora]